MENSKTQIRSMVFPGWVSRFHKWIARTAEEEGLFGQVKPGLYLVSVRGTIRQHFYALPVSQSLLDHIRQEAQSPEDAENLYCITCTDLLDIEPDD